MTFHSARLPCLSILVSLMAACGAEVPQTEAAGAALPPLDGDGRIGWQGRLACADCDGIDTSLALNRNGEHRDYLLIETYLATDGGVRFVERGRWLPQGDALIRLQASEGGERVYALQADGRLQPRDGNGRRFAPREGDFLMPVSTSSGQ